MKKHVLAALLIMPLAIASAYAGDTPPITFGGFGTVGATGTNTDKADFTRTNQPTGANKSNPSLGVDTNFGLQATVTANDTLSATGQVLVRKDGVANFAPEVSWAFAKIKATPELTFRLGRLGAPIYIASDYVNVGYASTMMRLPPELYSQNSLETIDGVDAIYQKSFGATTITTQLAYGRSNRKAVYGGNIIGKNYSIFNISAENGPISVRFGRSDAHIDWNGLVPFDTLHGTLNMVGFTDLASRLVVKDKKAAFTTLGMTLDWNNILVQSEIGKRTTDSWIADSTAWYLMGGYRIGKFLPYVAYSSLKQDSPKSDSTIPPFGPLVPLASAVNMVLTGTEQTTTTVGMRWDFAKNAAVKVQLDRMTPKSGGGLFMNQQPGFSNRPVTVFGASLDFVF